MTKFQPDGKLQSENADPKKTGQKMDTLWRVSLRNDATRCSWRTFGWARPCRRSDAAEWPGAERATPVAGLCTPGQT